MMREEQIKKMYADRSEMDLRIKEAERAAHEEERAALLAVLHDVMSRMVAGQTVFHVDYPGYGKIDVAVESIDFTNLFWKPIRARVLTEVVEETYMEEENAWGMEEPRQVMKTRKVSFTTSATTTIIDEKSDPSYIKAAIEICEEILAHEKEENVRPENVKFARKFLAKHR